MVSKRKMIRSVTTKFLRKHSFMGISEILDFFTSVISGYVIPLNQEKLAFFMDILIPLHKKPNCDLYFEKLVKCCIFFLKKEESLAVPLIESILFYFPLFDAVKANLFLKELNDIFQMIEIEKYDIYFKKFIPLLLEVIIKIFAEKNLTLTSNVLLLFTKPSFISLIKFYKHDCFYILVPLFAGLTENLLGLDNNSSQLNESVISITEILKDLDQETNQTNSTNSTGNQFVDSFVKINMILKNIDTDLYEISIKKSKK